MVNTLPGPTVPVEILAYGDAIRRSEAVPRGIDRIFWDTATATFGTADARAAFHDLWLGQYLRHDPALCSVAVAGDGHVAGYLVGCFDNPAMSPRFATLKYFQAFTAACRTYPAHLHINLDAAYRSRGIGQLLIERFVGQVADAGLPGLHVVTGAGLRNARFYRRCGFVEAMTAPHRSGEVLFLGRATDSGRQPRGGVRPGGV